MALTYSSTLQALLTCKLIESAHLRALKDDSCHAYQTYATVLQQNVPVSAAEARLHCTRSLKLAS